jgi:hypothetical protein
MKIMIIKINNQTMNLAELYYFFIYLKLQLFFECERAISHMRAYII